MAAVALPEQPLIEPLPGNPSFERGSTNLDTVAPEHTEAGFDEGNTEILSPTHSATNSAPVANDDVYSIVQSTQRSPGPAGGACCPTTTTPSSTLRTSAWSVRKPPSPRPQLEQST